MSGGMAVVLAATVLESDDGMEDVFAGFLPFEMPFCVVLLKLVIVL